MQSIYSMVFGSQPNASSEEQSGAEEEFKSANGENPKIIDRVSQFMHEDMVNQMLMFTLNDCSLSNLKPGSTSKKDKRQTKECEFMNASISLGNMAIFNAEDQCQHNTPVIIMSNDDYDEDQDQKAEERLPITEDLIFMRYNDGADDFDDSEDEGKANEVHGFVFFYPQLGLCKIIECEIDTPDKMDELQEFEDWLCKILYILNEEVQIRDEKSSLEIQQKQKNMYLQYAIKASLDVLIRQNKIVDIFSLTEDDQQKIIKGRQAARRNAKTMDEQVKKQRAASLTHKMSQLKIGQEDVKDLKTLDLKIEERLIQVIGHLYSYDSVLDRNVPVKDGLFLTIDRLEGGDQSSFGGRYQMSVIDQQQSVSYCSVEITTDRLIHPVTRDQTLMWAGDVRMSGQIPAWCFFVTEKECMEQLKGALTKATIETRNREMAVQSKEQAEDDNASEIGNEREWLEAALMGVENDDLSQSEDDKSELDYFDPDADNQNNQEYDEYHNGFDVEMEDRNELDRLEQEQEEINKLNDDLNPSFQDEDQKECLQSLSYNRAFVSQGNIVKIFKNEELTDQNQSKLQYMMHLPELLDNDGNKLNPSNMMLYNNENGLIFNDRATNSAYNYDLEKGTIIGSYPIDKDVVQMTNEFKNAQVSASQVFHGITAKSMFMVDPRVEKNNKIVVRKDYKQNPSFSCIGTTLGGGLALGSADGKIRLYKSLGGNASTLLPGLGDPIISIEVSRDGNWVLATTRGYLLLVPTMCENGKTGFDHRMGKEKPIPRKLYLNVRDLTQYKITQPHFKPARFNNFNQAGEETAIVTSTGDLLVTWNFTKVKRGQLGKYRIRKLDTAPIDNQFQVDRPELVLCTDTKNVGLVNRKKKVRFSQ